MTRILAVDFQKISNVLRGKYGNVYHLNEKIEYIYHDFYVTEWSLFKKHQDLDMYFSSKNKAILSSKNGNTLDDLTVFIKNLEKM